MSIFNIIKLPEMFDHTCYFEPTFKFSGFQQTLPMTCLPLSDVDFRSKGEVAHLALIRRQKTWTDILGLMKKQLEWAVFSCIKEFL